MKRFLLPAVAFALSATAFSQTADPVLMTVNGKPVTRSEFEYFYNKNNNIEGAVEQKTVDEYVDMFVNFKLKVAAAEDARIDTLTSFRQEFEQYRDMQLTPHLVDQEFIDSVAHSIYDQTATRLAGQDMLRLSHILIAVQQSAEQAEADKAKAKADSLYSRVLAGDDFADLAKRFSDDTGTATRGGELPWIGPGMTLKEFEDAAYALKAGEVSKVVKSSVGYHIIKMLERKQLEPYDTLRAEIIQSLKRQNIEEASAEARIRKMIAAGGGNVTREAIMDSVLTAETAKQPDLKYLVQEYHDGLLLYEISKEKTIDPSTKNVEALEQTFKANKKKYVWTEPRFKGFTVRAKNEKALKAAIKVLKKNADGDWRHAIKDEVNTDSVVVRVSGPLLVKKGSNAIVDKYVFGTGEVKPNAQFPLNGVSGKKQAQPKVYTDVKAQVEEDYRQKLEEAWVKELREKYSFSVNKEVLATVNKH